MSRWKPDSNRRIEDACKVAEKHQEVTLDCMLQRVLAELRECGKNLAGVVADFQIDVVDLDNLNYVKPVNSQLFFIEFTNDGYVVVVGAGEDYGRPHNSRYLNWKILRATNKEWNNKAIFISVTGLRKVKGRLNTGPENPKDKSTYLKCRNGVEMYIGERLLEKDIPILNMFSHKNYTDSTWKQVMFENKSVFSLGK